MKQLLDRDEFRSKVFERDKHECVMCGSLAVDAHHIIERRLFDDGGYYLDNGASLCASCHLLAEQTILYASKIREATGIKTIVLPPHFYDDCEYDKWGNIIDGDTRYAGELADDESVKKVMMFNVSRYVKYPRTYHLPWSPGKTDDDRVMPDVTGLMDNEIVMTGKMDGENTTMYSDYIHARSIDGRSNITRSWVKNFHSRICSDIPPRWRVCGENMWAKHSIEYNNLESYFLGFSIWNEYNVCLPWTETLEWFQLLGITPVPTIYRGIWRQEIVRGFDRIIDNNLGINEDTCEGYVVCVTGSFHVRDYRKKVGKYVRKEHVQTQKHWLSGQPIIQNKLKEVSP